MKLIFAQGNPGDQYIATRHNIGWQILDTLAKDLGASFSLKSKFLAYVAEATVDDEKVILVKPNTYYNQTGTSARLIADFYKIDTPNILVIHDDIALPLGTLRLRDKGSDAGNNGIKSLNAHLGLDYVRLRVGVASQLVDRQTHTDFVLSRLSSDEQATLDKMMPQIIDIIGQFIAGQHEPTTYKHVE